jgi:hypothetical protein
MSIPLKWYQLKDKVIITVLVNSIENYSIDIKDNDLIHIHIKTKQNSILNKELKLFKSIDPDESSWEYTTNIVITLKKIELLQWNTLTSNDDSLIKTDWSHWNYLGEENDSYLFDLSQIPTQSTLNTQEFIDELNVSGSDSDSE